MVLTDSKNSTKSGKFLEILGNYDSRRGENAAFKADRITHWISKGAQVSGTVHNLLVSKKIIEGKKINVLPLKKPIIKIKEEEKAPEVKEEKIEEIIEETTIETPINEVQTEVAEPVA